jgi:hypothetical protein
MWSMYATSPNDDRSGNMTSGPKGTDPTAKVHFTWDAWNRQTAVYADNGNGGPGSLIASYTYDGRNYRIRKHVTADANYDYFYNDGWQIVGERKNDSANAYAQYLWDNRYIDSPAVRFRDTNTDGTLDETLYYTNDVNYNVTAVVTAAGSVSERYVYSPYQPV